MRVVFRILARVANRVAWHVVLTELQYQRTTLTLKP